MYMYWRDGNIVYSSVFLTVWLRKIHIQTFTIYWRFHPSKSLYIRICGIILINIAETTVCHQMVKRKQPALCLPTRCDQAPRWRRYYRIHTKLHNCQKLKYQPQPCAQNAELDIKIHQLSESTWFASNFI